MNDARGDLALRKQLLLAQCKLYRAKLRYEFVALRRGPVAKLPLFGLFMLLAGRSRAGRWIVLAGKALAAVKTVRSVMAAMRR
jgi:hypothetical protein